MMARLIYSAIASADGYVEDAAGTFDWAAPRSPVALDFAGIGQAAVKVVFSRTLASAPGARTRIEREFDPGMVRPLKSAAEHDITVGGADRPQAS